MKENIISREGKKWKIMDYILYLETKIENIDYKLYKIESWTKAYPLKLFPEPDFKKAAEVLSKAGMTIDSISASNMRHVLNGIIRIIKEN